MKKVFTTTGNEKVLLKKVKGSDKQPGPVQLVVHLFFNLAKLSKEVEPGYPVRSFRHFLESTHMDKPHSCSGK